MERITDIRKKMADWHKMNTSYLNEIKTMVSEIKTANNLHVISYFTYTFHIFHEKGYENLCLGSYHIRNIGQKQLTNPIICIKISPEALFDFSGKYLYKDSKQKVQLSNAWERLNEPTDKQEFWLKPTHKNTLDPSETLTFSNFQVKWLPKSSYKGSIQGFTYGDELQEGMNALNQININGKIVEEEQKEDE
ncbi:hypothetical protein [Oceanobacillus senegalensis]|uniref:hypothetical protein n=1 Tax=Oceanobacillus senegalensis TaxID=1936063 RepID=UPI000A30BDF8|nr:hypothetical protein [Oceanobacillus senegalensis]